MITNAVNKLMLNPGFQLQQPQFGAPPVAPTAPIQMPQMMDTQLPQAPQAPQGGQQGGGQSTEGIIKMIMQMFAGG